MKNPKLITSLFVAILFCHTTLIAQDEAQPKVPKYVVTTQFHWSPDIVDFSMDDWKAIEKATKTHSRCLVLTEEPILNSFAESLSGRIASDFWQFLDAPVKVIGAENLPAVPLNIDLEKEMLPNSEKVYQGLVDLLAY